MMSRQYNSKESRKLNMQLLLLVMRHYSSQAITKELTMAACHASFSFKIASKIIWQKMVFLRGRIFRLGVHACKKRVEIFSYTLCHSKPFSTVIPWPISFQSKYFSKMVIICGRSPVFILVSRWSSFQKCWSAKVSISIPEKMYQSPGRLWGWRPIR